MWPPAFEEPIQHKSMFVEIRETDGKISLISESLFVNDVMHIYELFLVNLLLSHYFRHIDLSQWFSTISPWPTPKIQSWSHGPLNYLMNHLRTQNMLYYQTFMTSLDPQDPLYRSLEPMI